MRLAPRSEREAIPLSRIADDLSFQGRPILVQSGEFKYFFLTNITVAFLNGYGRDALRLGARVAKWTKR